MQDVYNDINNKASKGEIPKKVSQLENDSRFVDSSVLHSYAEASQLELYIKKSEVEPLVEKSVNKIKPSTTTMSSDGNVITTIYIDQSREVTTLYNGGDKIVSQKYDKNNTLIETITTVISENAIKTEVRR